MPIPSISFTRLQRLHDLRLALRPWKSNTRKRKPRGPPRKRPPRTLQRRQRWGRHRSSTSQPKETKAIKVVRKFTKYDKQVQSHGQFLELSQCSFIFSPQRNKVWVPNGAERPPKPNAQAPTAASRFAQRHSLSPLHLPRKCQQHRWAGGLDWGRAGRWFWGGVVSDWAKPMAHLLGLHHRAPLWGWCRL